LDFEVAAGFRVLVLPPSMRDLNYQLKQRCHRNRDGSFATHGDRATLWVYGQMHESFDYEIYGTRVVCNPCGYAPEALNKGFSREKVIEISWI